MISTHIDGIHDLGGMSGFGPVEVERDEPVFHEPWEALAFALNALGIAALGAYNADEPVLGLPPDWYKSPEYRARVVREPRPPLREMGLDLPESVAIRVWDTSAETRYMVLPLRPAGTEGWSEEQLATLVTREAMIGVARVDVGDHAPA